MKFFKQNKYNILCKFPPNWVFDENGVGLFVEVKNNKQRFNLSNNLIFNSILRTGWNDESEINRLWHLSNDKIIKTLTAKAFLITIWIHPDRNKFRNKTFFSTSEFEFRHQKKQYYSRNRIGWDGSFRMLKQMNSKFKYLMLKCIYRTGRLILESTKTSASTKVSNEIRELSVPHHLPVYPHSGRL